MYVWKVSNTQFIGSQYVFIGTYRLEHGKWNANFPFLLKYSMGAIAVVEYFYSIVYHKVPKPFSNEMHLLYRYIYICLQLTHTHTHVCPPSRIRGGQAKVINICLTYWSKCITGKWEVTRWQTKSKANTNSDEMWRVWPSICSPFEGAVSRCKLL